MNTYEMTNPLGSMPHYLRHLQRQGINESEFKRYSDFYLEIKARNNKIPYHASFELTPFCNFDCKMCYIHLTDKQFEKEGLLPTSEWRNIILQAYDLGLRSVTLTGGECLMFPGFRDLYLFLHNKGIKIAVLTNGYMLDDSYCRFFELHRPSVIQITLYGSSEETYEKVTGVKAYHKVIENLLRLRETGIPIVIGITPNRFMVKDMFSLIDQVSNLGIPYHINTMLYAPRENTGRQREDISTDQYIELIKYTYEKKGLTANPLNLSDISDGQTQNKKQYGLRCGGGRSSFMMRYDGFMSPCSALEHISTSVLDKGVANAWRYINEQVEKYKLPEECIECDLNKYCLHCVAIHKDAPISGHCNPSICERTTKMVEAGLLQSR